MVYTVEVPLMVVSTVETILDGIDDGREIVVELAEKLVGGMSPV